MEQDPMVLPHHVLSLPFVCGKLQPKNKFNHRNENTEKQRILGSADSSVLRKKRGMGLWEQLAATSSSPVGWIWAHTLKGRLLPV